MILVDIKAELQSQIRSKHLSKPFTIKTNKTKCLSFVDQWCRFGVKDGGR